MYRYSILYVLLLAGVGCFHKEAAADLAETYGTFTNLTTERAVRLEAADALIHYAPEAVLPLLLKSIAQHPPEGIICNCLGRKSEAKVPVSWQIYCEVHRAWNLQEAALSRDHGGAFMLNLLEQVKTRHARRQVIGSLHRHWTPEAEAPLATILRSTDEDLHLRAYAGRMLMQKGTNDYPSLLLELVEADTNEGNRHWFDLLTAPAYERPVEVKPAVVRLGFELMHASKRRHEETGDRYFIASRLEKYLRVSFQPERRPEHQGRYGLTPIYFAETVENATAWWNANRASYPPAKWRKIGSP